MKHIWHRLWGHDWTFAKEVGGLLVFSCSCGTVGHGTVGMGKIRHG